MKSRNCFGFCLFLFVSVCFGFCLGFCLFCFGFCLFCFGFCLFLGFCFLVLGGGAGRPEEGKKKIIIA